MHGPGAIGLGLWVDVARFAVDVADGKTIVGTAVWCVATSTATTSMTTRTGVPNAAAILAHIEVRPACRQTLARAFERVDHGLVVALAGHGLSLEHRFQERSNHHVVRIVELLVG